MAEEKEKSGNGMPEEHEHNSQGNPGSQQNDKPEQKENVEATRIMKLGSLEDSAEGGKITFNNVTARIGGVHVVNDQNNGRNGKVDLSEYVETRNPMTDFNLDRYLSPGRRVRMGKVVGKRGEGGMGAVYQIEVDRYELLKEMLLQGEAYHPRLRISKNDLIPGIKKRSMVVTEEHVRIADEIIEELRSGKTTLGLLTPDLEQKLKSSMAVIKVKKPERKGKSEERFDREIFISNRLKHENLVESFFPIPLEERDEDGNLLFRYVVQELVDMRELGKRAIPNIYPRLSNEAIVKIGYSIFKGLECAHSHKPPYVHRDVGPDQVLGKFTIEITTKDGREFKIPENKRFNPETKKFEDFDFWKRIDELGITKEDISKIHRRVDEVKLTDFGIARPLSRGKYSTVGETDTNTEIEGSMTDSGEFVGTPEWASSEQARYSKSVGIASDHMSMGTTMYMMSAGISPAYTSRTDRFQNESDMAAGLAAVIAYPDPEFDPKFVNQVIIEQIIAAEREAKADAKAQAESEGKSPDDIEKIVRDAKPDYLRLPSLVSMEVEELEMLLQEKNAGIRIRPKFIAEKFEKIVNEGLFDWKERQPEEERRMEEDGEKAFQKAVEAEKGISAGSYLEEQKVARMFEDAAAIIPEMIFEISCVPDNSRERAYEKARQHYEKALELARESERLNPNDPEISPAIVRLEDRLHYVVAHRRMEHKRADSYNLAPRSEKQRLIELKRKADEAEASMLGRWKFDAAADEWIDAMISHSRGLMSQDKFNAASTVLSYALDYVSRHTPKRGERADSRPLKRAGEYFNQINDITKKGSGELARKKAMYAKREDIEIKFNGVIRMIRALKFKDENGNDLIEERLNEIKTDLAPFDARDERGNKKYPGERERYEKRIEEMGKLSQDTQEEYSRFSPIFESYDALARKCEAWNRGLSRKDPILFEKAEIESSRISAQALSSGLGQLRKRLIGEEEFRMVEEGIESIAGERGSLEALEIMLSRASYEISIANAERLAEVSSKIDKYAEGQSMDKVEEGRRLVKELRSPTGIQNIGAKYVSEAEAAQLEKKAAEAIKKYEWEASKVEGFLRLMMDSRSAEAPTKADACVQLALSYIRDRGSLVESRVFMGMIPKEAIPANITELQAKADEFAKWKIAKISEKYGSQVPPLEEITAVPEWSENLAKRLLALNAMIEAYKRVGNTAGYVLKTRDGRLSSKLIDDFAAKAKAYVSSLQSVKARHEKYGEDGIVGSDSGADAVFKSELGKLCSTIEEGVCVAESSTTVYPTCEDMMGLVRRNDEILDILVRKKVPEGMEDPEKQKEYFSGLKSEMFDLIYNQLPKRVEDVIAQARQKLESDGIMQPENKRDYRTVADVLEHLNPSLALGYFEQYLNLLPQDKDESGKYVHGEANDVYAKVERIKAQVAPAKDCN